ncbi:MAG: hypothetical protein AAF429_09295 [Pseudomonadota bacterium]
MPFPRFRSDERGILSLELVIIVPLMLFWFAGTFVFFNAFHKWLKGVKANYTVADLISRQTSINNDFIYALDGVFDSISETRDAGSSYFVVTALQWHDHDDDPDTDLEMAIVWSEATNSDELTPTGVKIEDIEDRMPSYVPEYDQAIYVQSYTPYTPLFDWVGIPPIVFENDIVATLRFSPQLDHEEYPDPDPTAYNPDDDGDPSVDPDPGTDGSD